jgi:hypothetical protein
MYSCHYCGAFGGLAPHTIIIIICALLCYKCSHHGGRYDVCMLAMYAAVMYCSAAIVVYALSIDE